jgi:3-isopropylmalate dehydrogenase
MTQRSYEIAVLPGDGIGPEVIGAAQAVLDSAMRNGGIAFKTVEGRASVVMQTTLRGNV